MSGVTRKLVGIMRTQRNETPDDTYFLTSSRPLNPLTRLAQVLDVERLAQVRKVGRGRKTQEVLILDSSPLEPVHKQREAIGARACRQSRDNPLLLCH